MTGIGKPPGVDAVVAAVDLIGRAGGTSFEIGWTCPHTPDEPPNHNCSDVTWWASAKWRGTRSMTQGRQTPPAAATELARKVLRGAACRCGQTVSLDGGSGCPWRLVGDQWVPGCDEPPIKVAGPRGDLAAMRTAYNRAGRRRRR